MNKNSAVKHKTQTSKDKLLQQQSFGNGHSAKFQPRFSSRNPEESLIENYQKCDSIFKSDFSRNYYKNSEKTNLAAEVASVSSMLADFDLLDLLTQAGTITGTILSNNSNLLGSFTLQNKITPLTTN